MNEAQLLPIGEVAKTLGVSVDTLRRWERAGRISAVRTPSGQRRFTLTEVRRIQDGRAHEGRSAS